MAPNGAKGSAVTLPEDSCDIKPPPGCALESRALGHAGKQPLAPDHEPEYGHGISDARQREHPSAGPQRRGLEMENDQGEDQHP